MNPLVEELALTSPAVWATEIIVEA
jgi:hypothetical protein